MKRVQPQIEELKVRHAKDPQKLRQEQALPDAEGRRLSAARRLPADVRAAAGVLRAVLGAARELRSAPAPFFLWVQDLSKPDHFMRIDLTLPWLGAIPYLNLLPILMVVLWCCSSG
jgi:membrane protein insertase Oxa1/YidC/SpoIIIJ